VIDSRGVLRSRGTRCGPASHDRARNSGPFPAAMYSCSDASLCLNVVADEEPFRAFSTGGVFGHRAFRTCRSAWAKTEGPSRDRLTAAHIGLISLRKRVTSASAIRPGGERSQMLGPMSKPPLLCRTLSRRPIFANDSAIASHETDSGTSSRELDSERGGRTTHFHGSRGPDGQGVRCRQHGEHDGVVDGLRPCG
jgi:hypothetical protein